MGRGESSFRCLVPQLTCVHEGLDICGVSDTSGLSPVSFALYHIIYTQQAIPLRLNYPGTFSTHGNNSPGAYLAPPKDFRDLESRRRTWWLTIVFDRIASVGGWVHSVDENDIGTELPLRDFDFEMQVIPLVSILLPESLKWSCQESGSEQPARPRQS